jgi:hypothetical protein
MLGLHERVVHGGGRARLGVPTLDDLVMQSELDAPTGAVPLEDATVAREEPPEGLGLPLNLIPVKGHVPRDSLGPQRVRSAYPSLQVRCGRTRAQEPGGRPRAAAVPPVDRLKRGALGRR